MNNDELQGLSDRIRLRVVEMSHASGAPHLGSSLSCIDILVALYWGVLRVEPSSYDAQNRDRFILSKGHAASALYATLALRGFFSTEVLNNFCKPGDNLPEQPSPGCARGVEWATGSLGHGLSVGTGMALAAQISGNPHRVACLLSDGECNEGSVWEAALLAPAHKLGRLAVIVDYNKWQATGRSQEITSIEPLAKKFAAFGWKTKEIDGHDFSAILAAFAGWGDGEAPLAIVAHTVKGKGVSMMEDDNNWHYRIPTAEEVEQARRELTSK